VPPEEVEDEFNSIYVDYRAKSAQDLDHLFAVALEIRDMTQEVAALRSLAARLANIDRLCDRSTFRAIGV
jgi:hypothetical protein